MKSKNMNAKENEKRSGRTTIVAYKKKEFDETELKGEMKRMERECQCDVQNLPHVGVFVLTYQSTMHKRASKIFLNATKEMGADDVDVGVFSDVQSRIAASDPYFLHQWALLNLANDSDINMQAGWDEYRHGTNSGELRYNVTVAVIDTGIDYNHEDLKTMMWINTREIPGNGIDDDGNGIVDDIHGADFTQIPPSGDPMARNSSWSSYDHGTACAGIIGAQEGNYRGIVGVASYAQGRIKLMALKGLSQKASSISGLLQCLNYAIEQGASISSNSWGTSCDEISCYSLTLEMESVWKTVLQNNPDHLFIAGAGGSNKFINGGYKPLPCGIQEPNLLCATASTKMNQKYSNSNYGANYVHVFAPGEKIATTTPGNEYRYKSGTSMACPHVSGLAALIRTMNKNLNGQDVKQLIELNVNKKDAYTALVSSGGLIDAAKTIHAVRIAGMNVVFS